jgi:hypothetical protein
MKRFVARCPATDIAIIVAVSELVAVPTEGTNISIPCPGCRNVHVMTVRETKHQREAS